MGSEMGFFNSIDLKQVHQLLVASSYLQLDLLTDRCNAYIANYINTQDHETLEIEMETSYDEKLRLMEKYEHFISN